MLFKSVFVSSLATSALAIYLPEDHYLAKAPAIQEGSCNCTGPNIRYNKSLANDYICGDRRLGPSRLPTKLPLGTFVTGYDRFGGDSPNEFLGKWYNSTQGPDGREAGWIYPEKYGFHLDEEKLPVKANIDLMPGTLVDRFGYNTGRYISPATAPFAQRALHPQNLDNDVNKEFPNNYHVYNVTRMFTVQAGPIRPWFGQPGFGVQFFLGNGINVKDYLDNGHLKELKPSDLVKDRTGCGFKREDDEPVSDEL